MTTIEFLKNWLVNSPLMVNFTQNYDFIEQIPNQSGLFSNGTQKYKETIIGDEYYRANFVLYSGLQAFTDYDRLSNSDFLTQLGYSMNQIKGDEIVEIIDGIERKGNIESVTTSNGMMYTLPTNDMNDGVIYQLQFQVEYKIKGE